MDYRKFLFYVLPLSLFLLPSFAKSQTPSITARQHLVSPDVRLSEQFTEYQTYSLNSAAFAEIVRAEDFAHNVKLNIPGYGEFDLQLVENPLLSDGYQLTLKGENGFTRIPWDGKVKTFHGTLTGGKYLISLTIDEGFLRGGIQLPNKDELRIEPLRFHTDHADRDDIIVYKVSASLERREFGCEVKYHPDMHDEGQAEDHHGEQRVVCRTIQAAFANDWLMYLDYNQDVGDVENHNLSVLNDVQTNYDTEFADDYVFDLVEVWISTCSSCDPWTNSTNSGALLDDFTDWGPNGFDNTHDIGGLWTDRDFNGSTIGVSWLDAACSQWRYLTTQDFSSNGQLLRSLMAHEMGHNFGSEHDADGSQTIMAPTLVNTNTWSSSSINQINNYLDDVNCLSVCQSVQAPVADFEADETEGCDPFVVHFDDQSTGPPSQWEWTFPGGTPSSSTQQNPTVTYNTPGVYDVILEVSNSAGSNTLVRTDYITVLAEPVADFTFSQDDLTVTFTNLSDFATEWLWEFGDGETSTLENPVHTYDEDGEYEVTLTAINDCGEDVDVIDIEVVTPPMADFSYNVDIGCVPLVVQFFNESTDNAESFEWLFPGGTPSSSTQENPVITYHNAGFYDVTLIVENSAGVDEFHINNLIEVLPVPEADFDFAVNGLSVQFANASVDADSYLWTFGDGETSTAVDPNHVYENGGTYQVTLVATNDCGSDTYVLTVTLNAAPVADFIASASSGCPPLTVTFTSTSLGVVTSYNWSFPGGSPSSSTQAMPTVTYNAVGTFDVRLIVGNSVGFDTLLLEDFITVVNDVTSDFTAEVDGSIVDFINESSGAMTFLWMIDGNEFTEEDVTYVFQNNGSYEVMLIASGECGSDTSIQTIEIVTAPVAGVGSDVTSGCQPLTVEFINLSSSNATTFAWEFEGGTPSTSSEENPVVVYQNPGTYDVQLTVWGAGGMDEILITDMIEVVPLPIADFETVQTGTQVEFQNGSVYGDTYFWEFGDGNTSSEENPVHNFEDFGSYSVTLTVENDCGIDAVVIEISLSTAPVPMFNASTTDGCVPFTVQFIDESQNGPEFWEWSFPGGTPDTSNAQNPVVTYNAPGVYPVMLRVSNAGGAQAIVRDEYIHVDFPAVAAFNTFIEGGTVTFTNNSEEADYYLWAFGDGSFDTLTHPVHNYQVSGTYPVQLIAVNACSADTTVQQVTVTVTGVQDISVFRDVRVYPNPNTGAFTLAVDGPEDGFEIEVYDILGARVQHEAMNPNQQGLSEIQLLDARPGVFSLVLRKSESTFVTKIVVID